MRNLTEESLCAPPRLPRFAFLAKPLGKLLTLAAKLGRKHRYDEFRLETVRGLRFIVIPTVFNPKVLRSGEFFASVIDSELTRDREVLDMGTGSGVGAVFAARRARRVVAIDINPAAVRCAGINAQLNHVENEVDVRHGDLFAPVADECFDLILFNPPFFRGTPRDDRDRAWRATDVAERFARELHAHLHPGGIALVLLSTYGDAAAFLDQFQQNACAVSVFAERRFINETLTIYRLTLPRPT